MDGVTIEQWYKSLPIITRIAFTVAFSTTVLASLHIVSPSILILNWPMVTNKLQIWRLLTSVTFFGGFGFGFLFQLYFFQQFSTKLENNEVFRQPGDYLFFILVQTLLLDVLSLVLYYPTGAPMLGQALVFSITYYWSRREPYADLSMYGFKVKGYQLPFALLLFHILLGGSIWLELLGLASAHLWYFCKEIVPAEYGIVLIKTPSFLNSFMARQLGRTATAPAGVRGGAGAGAPPPPPAAPRFGGAGQRLGGN
mmetsp:Transcript_56605/g.132825  ORF Transcript_56605/g.132825 Transcript_56605/m.132825 type:complete len:254 (+) Transcript_56605:65-826(+)